MMITGKTACGLYGNSPSQFSSKYLKTILKFKIYLKNKVTIRIWPKHE